MRTDELTSSRYIGRVCHKHPELKGLRKKSSANCIGCFREYHENLRKTEHRKQWSKNYKHRYNSEYNQRPDQKEALRFHVRARENHISTKAFKDYGEFDRLLIVEVYHLSKLRTKTTGIKWVVDHIVPLKGKNVCGFHVGANLQVIPYVINSMKGNRYDS